MGAGWAVRSASRRGDSGRAGQTVPYAMRGPGEGREEELSAILQRKADMRTPRDLSPYFREEVLRTARVQYAA